MAPKVKTGKNSKFLENCFELVSPGLSHRFGAIQRYHGHKILSPW
jgi:hypothetical protein